MMLKPEDEQIHQRKTVKFRCFKISSVPACVFEKTDMGRECISYLLWKILIYWDTFEVEWKLYLVLFFKC